MKRAGKAVSTMIAFAIALGLVPIPAIAGEQVMAQSLQAGISQQGAKAETYTRKAAVMATTDNGGVSVCRIGSADAIFFGPNDFTGAYEASNPEETKAYLKKRSKASGQGSLKRVFFSGSTPTKIYVFDKEIGPWDSPGKSNLEYDMGVSYCYENGKAVFQPIAYIALDFPKIKASAKQIIEMPKCIQYWLSKNMPDYNLLPFNSTGKEKDTAYAHGRARAWSLFLYDAFCCDYDAAKLGKLYATSKYNALQCRKALQPMMKAIKSINEGPRYKLASKSSRSYARKYADYEQENVVLQWKNGKVYSKTDFCSIANDYYYYYQGLNNVDNGRVYTGRPIKPKPKLVYCYSLDDFKRQYYSVTYRNNVKVGTATVTLKGRGIFKGTITDSFEIIPKTTDITGFKRGRGAFTVKWKKQPVQTSGFVVMYDDLTNKDGFSNSSKRLVVKGASKTKATIKGLKSKTNYSVVVIPYKTVKGKNYYAYASRTKTVTVK